MVFILLAKVTASGENPQYAEGEIHGCMIYCRADEKAGPNYDEIRTEMWDAHWEDAEFLKQGIVEENRFENTPAEDSHRQAYEAAKENGLSFVIYQRPDSPPPSS